MNPTSTSGPRRIAADQVLWSVPAEERDGRPLLVMLHGHGMDERMGLDLRHRLPDELVLASVRGPLRARGGYGWFPLDASLTMDQIDTVAHEVMSWLLAQSGFTSVGVLGFSQGSAIALHCMRLAPDRFAYGVVLSGFVVPGRIPGDAQLAALKPPVFSGRGDADGLVPQLLVTMTDVWLSQHTTLTKKTYRGLGHTVSEQEITDLADFLTRRIS